MIDLIDATEVRALMAELVYADGHREGWGEFLDRLAGVLAVGQQG
jgi:hypothetical protein